MIDASGLKAGMVILLDGELHSVSSAEHHVGGGQQAGAVFARLKHLKTGHIKELRLHLSDRLEDVVLEHKEMEYLYTDGVAWGLRWPPPWPLQGMQNRNWCSAFRLLTAFVRLIPCHSTG
ncbi:hypothetical protein [Cupriavidus sp. CP313]